MPKKEVQAETFTEDARRDPQALLTRDVLREQKQVPVLLAWSDDDEQKFQAGKYLPYPKVETVSVNGVKYHIERGVPTNVPQQVAVILMEAKKIHPNLVPDCRDKQIILDEWDREKREREARYQARGLELAR
jgi:hypothetical protein